MKECWTTRWKALLIWVCGYLNIVAYVIAGGYVIVKSENEELKKTAKQAFLVTLIFTGISVFLSLYSSIGAMADDFYSSQAYSFYNVMLQIATVAKIIVFVVFALISFFHDYSDKENMIVKQINANDENEEDSKNKITRI